MKHRTGRTGDLQILGIGKMCLLQCILLISIKKRNRLQFSWMSDLHFVTFAAYSVYDIAVFGAGAVFRDTHYKCMIMTVNIWCKSINFYSRKR